MKKTFLAALLLVSLFGFKEAKAYQMNFSASDGIGGNTSITANGIDAVAPTLTTSASSIWLYVESGPLDGTPYLLKSSSPSTAYSGVVALPIDSGFNNQFISGLVPGNYSFSARISNTQDGGTTYLYATIPVHVVSPAATVDIVNNCTVNGVAAGTWTFSGDGSTGTASATKIVTPASGGSNYSVSFSAPSGYTGSVSPTGSVNLVAGGSATFTTSCTKNASDVVLNLSVSPNPYSCSAGTTLSWTVTNATSCTASGGWSGAKSATDGTYTEVVHPSGATTYTLDCSGSGAPATQSVSVTAPSPSCPVSPAVTVTANPITIDPGQSTIVSWSANSLIVSCSPVTWANNSTALSGTTSQSPVTTTTYSATCTGNDGNPYTGSATVTVTSAGSAPTVSLSASPTSITSGGSSNLTWTTGNSPTSCTASGGWSGTKTATGGTSSVSPASTTTYTLTCSNTFGSGSSSATVTVTAAAATPTVSVSASPTSIASGGSSTITWSTTNATSCAASWTASTATSGTQSVSPTQTTTYSMTCTGAGGSNGGSTTVTVGAGTAPVVHDSTFNMTINPSPDVTVSCSASPSPAVVGQQVVWTATPSGGTAPYKYTWTGTDFGTPSPTDNPFSFTYQTTGSKTAQVTVRDNNGLGLAIQCPVSQLQVNVKPIIKEF